MGIWKIWVPFFCVILIVGFVFSHSALSKLTEKTAALEQAGLEMKETVNEWIDQAANTRTVPTQGTPQDPPEKEPEETPPVQEEDFTCIMRTCDEKIGIYTPEGYLIRFLDTDLRTLPKSDLATLEKGILISSRAELISRIEDFER